MSKKASSYLKGATILTAAGFLSRLLGLFFKVPLYRIVGSFGNGIYGNVTNIYNMLLMVSTVGIPVAISKMVSESTAVGDYRGAKDVFRVSTTALLILGAVSSLILGFGAHAIIRLAHWPKESYAAIIAIAPAPFIISVCSAFRGFFQGFQIMTPTAVSQILEQIVRVALGIFLCWYFMHGLRHDVGKSVGGAVFGATAGGIIAALFLVYVFWIFMSTYRKKLRKTTRSHPRRWQSILKRLVIIAIPVTLTSVIVSLFATINSFIYVGRLSVAGISAHTATEMFGDFTNVDTLVNVPLVISSNLAVAMIPAISESFALREKKLMNHKIDLAIRIIILAGLPFCVGMSVLSTAIFRLLFPGSKYGPGMLQVFAYATMFMMLSNTFQSILQSIDRFRVPLVTLSLGIIVFTVTGWITMAIPAINIYGMGIDYMLTFIYLTVANYACVKKFTGVRIHWRQSVMKPIVSAAVMGLATAAVYNGLYPHIGNVLSMLLAFIAAVLVYSFMIVFTGVLSDEEMDVMPGKNKLMPMYHRIVGLRKKVFSR